MAFPADNNKFYALKLSAETTYQYLKIGKGILANVTKPTTPQEAKELSDVINARMAGKDMPANGTTKTAAKGYGSPIVLTNKASLAGSTLAG